MRYGGESQHGEYDPFGGFRRMEPYGFSYEHAWSGEARPFFGRERPWAAYRRTYEHARPHEDTAERSAVHSWRGGVLGWIGSGIRAATAWTGLQMQRWGSFLGGKLSGRAQEMGDTVRGGGERVGSALEQSGASGMRELEQPRGGKLPRSYRRPDERILDDVYQRISRSWADAEEVEIEVNDGTVTLSGSVPSRADKRLIEEIADDVFGVVEVHNHLKLARRFEGPAARQGGEPQQARAGEAGWQQNGQDAAPAESQPQ